MRFKFEYPIGSNRTCFWSGSVAAFLKYPPGKQNAVMLALERLPREDKIGLQMAVVDSGDAADFCQLRELMDHLVGDLDKHSRPAPEITIVACTLAVKNNEKCPICWEPMACPGEIAVATKCRHAFCKKCIVSWVSKKQSCPVCRGCTRNSLVSLGKRDLATTHDLLRAPEKVSGSMSERVQRILNIE